MFSAALLVSLFCYLVSTEASSGQADEPRAIVSHPSTCNNCQRPTNQGQNFRKVFTAEHIVRRC